MKGNTTGRWLVCASDRIGFDHVRCFRELGSCHWKMSFKAQVDDIVYIYVSAEKKIMFKTCVMSIDNPPKSWEDDKYWNDKTKTKKEQTMELRLLDEYHGNLLGEDALSRLGYGRNCRQKPTYGNKNLMVYIEDCFNSYNIDSFGVEEIPCSQSNSYHEHRKIVQVSVFERSQKLRDDCIKAQGGKYECNVCGFDFKTVYGDEIGRDFIHVHHILPLSLMDNTPKDYQPDPATDLIPVCPNCHAMIHRMLRIREVKSKEDCQKAIDELKGLFKTR